MLISLGIDETAANLILQEPTVAELCASMGLKRPLVIFSPTGVALKATIGETRLKIKIGLGARDGQLVVDLRDVRTPLGSVGGNWIEGLVAKLAPKGSGYTLRRVDDSLEIAVDAARFRAVGVNADGQHLQAIVEL